MNRGPGLTCIAPTFRPARRMLRRRAWLSPGRSRRNRFLPGLPLRGDAETLPRRCPWPVVANSRSLAATGSALSPPATRNCFRTAASPAPQLALQRRGQIHRLPPGGIASARSRLPRAVRRSWRREGPSRTRFTAPTRIAPRRAALALRYAAGAAASCVSTTSPRLTGVRSPETLASRGRRRPTGPAEIAFSGAAFFRLTRAEARGGRRALPVRSRGPDEHRCPPHPPWFCGVGPGIASLASSASPQPPAETGVGGLL